VLSYERYSKNPGGTGLGFMSIIAILQITRLLISRLEPDGTVLPS
jgi:hypothetical protein